jgi:hypothetical protein
MIFSLAEQWFVTVLLVGLLWLHHIHSLANVTIATIAIGKVSKIVVPRTSCIILNLLFSVQYCLCFYCYCSYWTHVLLCLTTFLMKANACGPRAKSWSSLAYTFGLNGHTSPPISPLNREFNILTLVTTINKAAA